MGSLFLNSYQSWDEFDRMSPYKKESNSAPTMGMSNDNCGSSNSQPWNSRANEVLDHNMYVEMIKKEMGFSEYDQYLNADDGRRSPQYDRLMREVVTQHISEDITKVANDIAISTDPREWSVDDTCTWLRHYAIRYSIPGNITEFLKADGETICSYNLQDFVVRIGCETAGNQIKDQLDLWKLAGRSMNGGAPFNFQRQQMYMNPKLEQADQCSRSQSNKFALDINCGWGPAPPPQVFTTPAAPELMSPNQYISNTNQPQLNNIEQSNMNPTNAFHDMGRTSFQQFTAQTNQPQMPSYFTNEGRYLPKPTIPLDRFASVREACQDNGMLSLEHYQKFINMTPPPTMASMFPNISGNEAGQNTSKGSIHVHIPATSTARFDDSFEDGRERVPPHIQQQQQQQPPAVSPQQMRVEEPGQIELKTPVMRDLDEDDLESSYLDLNLINLKQEADAETLEHPKPEEPPIKNPPSDKPSKKKSSKHPIHLWEFLKQLLHEGKDCIRWIDEEKGVFKIYNSQQVAKYWGERKNRPAMNYDKLSRSIRQYYKKGIIKKTTQGKRLVYQFCEAYL